MPFQPFLSLPKQDKNSHWLWSACSPSECRIPACQIVGNYFAIHIRKLFGLILADRGSEFDDVAGIERGGRCRIYYTDPRRPDQKGSCEKNHVELRKIIKKGTSIDDLGLDSWVVVGICSRTNSSLRLAIGNASPMTLAKAPLPASLLEAQALEQVDGLKRERDSMRNG